MKGRVSKNYYLLTSKTAYYMETLQSREGTFLTLNFKLMQIHFLKVIAQTETVYVQSKRTGNGLMARCYIRLRMLGGEHEDEYLCTLLGDQAQCRFTPDAVVAASLRFKVHENGGRWFQEVVVHDIVPLR